MEIDIEDTPADIHRRKVREQQLREEGRALKMLAEEKRSYYLSPNCHPKYAEKWSSFWIAKEEALSAKGIKIETIDLTPEWTEVWKRFVDAENMEKITAKKAEIYQKWNKILQDPDSFPEPETEIIALSESDEEPPVSPPSAQLIPKEESKTNIIRKHEAAPQEDMEGEVLSLLNLLFQLSTKNLLSSGEEISMMREVALSVEAEEFGSSKQLLDDEDCFNLMDQAAETLKLKMIKKQVPEIHAPVVKLTLDRISVFLSKSSCQKSDILVIESHSPIRSDDSSVLKLTITKRIEQEFERAGTNLSQKELASLVEAELVRLKHSLPSQSDTKMPLQMTSDQHDASSSAGDLFWAYSSNLPDPQMASARSSNLGPQSPIDWNNIMRGLQSVHQSENVEFSQNNNSGLSNFQIEENPVQAGADPFQNSFLSDQELAKLMKNFNKFDDSQKDALRTVMRELERVDPEKMQRIYKLIHNR